MSPAERLRIFTTIEPGITDSVDLAEKLRGVAKAISATIIVAGFSGPNQASTQKDLPELGETSRVAVKNGPQVGKILFVRPFRNSNIRVGIHHQGSSNIIKPSEVTHDTILPSDQAIDRLLSQEPCFWEDMSCYARDAREGAIKVVYPFHNQLYTEGTVPAYLAIAQDLSSQLLKALE